MGLNRRHVIAVGAAALIAAAGRTRVAPAAESAALTALDNSRLIYLSPLVSNGRESRCHAEVWFVHRGEEIFVCTWADKWRAEAMRRGFSRARIWIGDFGPWRAAQERYRSAPSLDIAGRFETEPAVHAELLREFAAKYETQWPAWDRRVREGFVNGRWVLLRYQVVS